MTGAEFKKIINYYGEENILGIGFDNSAAVTFAKGEFSLANMYIEDLEVLQEVVFDSRANPFHVIRHVSNIQSIMVRDAGTPIEVYDRYSIRP